MKRELNTLEDCRQFIMFLEMYYMRQDKTEYKRLRAIITDRMTELIEGKKCPEA